MTTQFLRKLIEVFDIEEDAEKIIIDYWRQDDPDTPRHLTVIRQEHTSLMRFVDGPVCQWDAINIVVEHEMECEMECVKLLDAGDLQRHVKNWMEGNNSKTNQ